jgi:hypothetical protein
MLETIPGNFKILVFVRWLDSFEEAFGITEQIQTDLERQIFVLVIHNFQEVCVMGDGVLPLLLPPSGFGGNTKVGFG